MANGELLQIEPQELQFPFELKKQISCSMQLINKSEKYVAFKVKTTNPKKYCVRPNTGVVLPYSTCDVIVTMQAQKEAPPDMQCTDKFLVQSAVTDEGVSAKDITPNMFNKEEGRIVEDCKLKVAYVAPPQPPSPVREGSEEGSSPRASVSENGGLGTSEFTTGGKSVTEPQVFRSFTQSQDSSSEVRALIAKLTEEKNSAIQHKKKLQQELEVLKRRSNQNRGGIPLKYVIIFALLGILLGYYLKSTK